MAKKQSIYQKQLKALKEASTNFGSSSNANTMANQISNYQTRLKGAGINPSQATDKRNWFEKLTNLPEGQNALFDALELINRPQQALFGAIEAAQEGGDVLEGAKSGFSGEEDYYFGDILRNAGVDDKPLFTGPLSGEDRSLADVLGLAGDVLLDPVDIPMFALKPVSAAAKGIDTAGDVAKAASKADDVLDATRYAYKFDPIAAMTTKGSKSLLEGAVGGLTKGVGKAVKGVGNAAINAADLSTVKKLATDSGLIEKGTKITKENMPEIVKKLTDAGIDVSLKSDAIKDAGQILNRSFNYKGSLPDNLYETINKGSNEIDASAIYARELGGQTRKAMQEYADSVGKTLEEIDEDMLTLANYKYKSEGNVGYYVRNALEKGNKSDIIRADEDTVKALKNSVEEWVAKTPNVTDNAIRVVPVEGGAKIEGNRKLLSAIRNDPKKMEALNNIRVSQTFDLDEDLLEESLKLNELYNSNTEAGKAFKKLYDESEPIYKKYANVLGQSTNGKISLSPITKDNYTRIALTEEGKELKRQLKSMGIDISKFEEGTLNAGSKTTFGTKKNVSAKQAEREIHKEIDARIAAADEKLENLKAKQTFLENRKASLSSTNKTKGGYRDPDKLRLEAQIKENEIRESTRIANAKKNVEKFSENKAKADKIIKDKNDIIYNVSDHITDDVIKKAKTISNPKEALKLTKDYDKYVKNIQKYDDLIGKIADPNITVKKYKSLEKQLAKINDKLIDLDYTIIDDTARISGAVDERTIREANKLANKVSKQAANAQKTLTNAQARAASNLDKMKQAKQSITDIANEFGKKQDDLRLQLKEVVRKHHNLENVEKELKAITDEIQKTERIKSLYQTGAGQKLYSTSFLQSFDDFAKMGAKETKALNNYNEILLQSGLDNDNVVKFFKPGEKVDLGPNMKLVSKEDFNDMVSYMNNYRDLMPNDSKLLSDFAYKGSKSSNIAIDKDLLDMMKIGKSSKNDANMFLDTMDKANSLFKKTSTFSPGFHLRNITGNWSNMTVSGMGPIDKAKAYSRAYKLTEPDYIVKLYSKHAESLLDPKITMSAKEAADFKIVQQFIQSGAMGSGKDIRDLGELIDKAAKDKESANMFKKVWNGVFEVSAKANEKVDNLSRMAVLSHAVENPSYVRKLGAKNAIDAMHEVVFDPQNMSNFEKKYMKRLIPFYTFTKQNLMFQAKNIVNNTTKYNRLMKTFNKAYDAVGEGNYRQYQKENFEIPLFKTDEGNLVGLKSNLPVGDLGEYLSNPLQRLVSSTTPMIKTPFEQVTGVDTFTGRDISDRSLLQAILDTTGLSNLTTKQYDKLQKLAEAGEIDANTLATLFPSVFRTNDASKIANQQQYEELMAYQDYVKQLKNQGIDVPTIKELTSSTQSSIRNIKNYRKKRSR